MKQNENFASGGVTTSQWVEQLNAQLESDTAKLYAEAFSAGYQYDFAVADALADVAMLTTLSAERDIAMRLYRDERDASSVLRFRLARKGAQIALSDVLPLLENFGLRVLGGRPYQLTTSNGDKVTLHVFELEYAAPGGSAGSENAAMDSIDAIAPTFEEAFLQVWRGFAESDGFNRLVLTGEVDCRQEGLEIVSRDH